MISLRMDFGVLLGQWALLQGCPHHSMSMTNLGEFPSPCHIRARIQIDDPFLADFGSANDLKIALAFSAAEASGT